MNWFKIGVGLGLLSICCLWIAQSLALPFPSYARASKVGPAHFPLLVASFLSFLTILWLVREHEKSQEEPEVRGIRLIPWYLGYASYVVLVPVLGFVPATFVLTAVITGLKIKGPWPLRMSKSLIAAIFITGVEWGIFQKWLGIPLPTGILWPWGR